MVFERRTGKSRFPGGTVSSLWFEARAGVRAVRALGSMTFSPVAYQESQLNAALDSGKPQ